MTSRAPLLAPAALLCLLAVTGCGTSGGAGPIGPPGTPSAPATPHASATPATPAYGTEHRTLTVAPGERFSLTVPAAPTLGQNWYLAKPGPDATVLTYQGERADYGSAGKDVDGSTDGTQSFGFTALAKGTTTVRLLYCPMDACTGKPSASPSPYPTLTARPRAQAGYYVFTITVR
ncbi:protease inhibitor I42 family protein [Streptomyces sp. CoH27]|uniref:protease inhibitor I42 family protein n=1 Tax=Streptomyces sp. CoH27 TaxID=2875763 RepID=UPI001CD28BFD|nr:protease inhibitor I42 family protein [Streptomyces sp. CoH27]